MKLTQVGSIIRAVAFLCFSPMLVGAERECIGAQGTAWTLAAKPTVSIAAFGDTVLLARVVGATTLLDGTIAVRDERLLRVLFFTRNGKPIASLGRRGGGPGEFQTLMWMGQCGGDTLSVFDPAQARVTRVDAKGKLVGVRPAMPPGPVGYSQSMGPVPYILGCGRRGAFAMVGWPHQLPPTQPGPHRSTVSIRVARDVASEYKVLGTFSGPERYRFPKSDGPRPFGKTVLVALSENRVFVGTADSFYVEMYDLDGIKRGNIRREVAPKRFRAPD